MRFAAALLLLLALVPAGLAATDPRAEKERLIPADMALAERATLQSSDLTQAWKRIAPASNDTKVPSCPGYRPDFSRFTITGKHQSAFESAAGATILSNVEVYSSRAQAVGDFRLGTQPPVARCLGRLLEQALGSASPLDVRVTSSRRTAAPRVGERSAAYRLVAEMAAGGQTVRLYLDVFVFQRGRSIAGLFFTSVFQPLKDQAPLARAVAARLR
jgi:hypothetical protein